MTNASGKDAGKQADRGQRRRPGLSSPSAAAVRRVAENASRYRGGEAGGANPYAGLSPQTPLSPKRRLTVADRGPRGKRRCNTVERELVVHRINAETACSAGIRRLCKGTSQTVVHKSPKRCIDEMRVHVRVRDVELDLGHVEREGNGGRLVSPKPSQFDQLLAALERMPTKRVRAPTLGQEARAAVGACLRWGSYLALLMDEARPLAPTATIPGTSRVSDREMARINIEASANLARWLEIAHREPERYARLVSAAETLPLPPSPRAHPEILTRMVQPKVLELGAMLAAQAPADAEDVKRSPLRSLANTFVHTCWRNGGPIEDLHAGSADRVRLGERRFTSDETRLLTRDAIARFTDAIQAFRLLDLEWDSPRFPQYVIAYRLMPFVGAPGWTTTEDSRSIALRPDELDS